MIGRSGVVQDTASPAWAAEIFCFDPSNSREGQLCFEIRDDLPQPPKPPKLLHSGCIRLPLPPGFHELPMCNASHADGACTESSPCRLRFVANPPPPPAPRWLSVHPPPPPPFELKGKLTPGKCDAMLRDSTFLFRRMWDAEPWKQRHTEQVSLA